VFSWLTVDYHTKRVPSTKRPNSEPLFSGKADVIRATAEIAKAIDGNIIRLEQYGLL